MPTQLPQASLRHLCLGLHAAPPPHTEETGGDRGQQQRATVWTLAAGFFLRCLFQ